MKDAYPDWNVESTRVRELMDAGNYTRVYEWIRHVDSGYEQFSPNEVLEILGKDGKPNMDQLLKLTTRAKEILEKVKREPLRRQLANDFRESYDFVPASWD